MTIGFKILLFKGIKKPLTNKQLEIKKKYNDKCIENVFEYFNHTIKKTTTNIICGCLTCKSINEFDCSALMKNKIRCSKCLINKYSNKCKNNHFEYISHKNQYVKCKCLSCNSINEFLSFHLIKNNIRCFNCIINKYKNKCKNNHFEYINYKNKYIECKCLSCNSINKFHCSALINNSIKCKCQKKPFTIGYVYSLTLLNYEYRGITDCSLKSRFNSHMRSCFNKRKKNCYWRYEPFRKILCEITGKSLGELTKEDFKTHIKMTKLQEITTTKEELYNLETKLINEIPNDKLVLNIAKVKDKSRIIKRNSI